MTHLLKIVLILLQLFVIPLCAAENSQPYCYKNTTETSYKVVTKTRLKSVTSKNFFKKIAFKKDTQVETYEDQEPVYKIKLERICCEGYKINEFNLCEPQCVKNGCPQNSRCVGPEVCECEKGYFSVRSALDGKHYCEPICEEPCPEYSDCVGPNQCACKKGYQYIEQICKPYCASGCPHGGVCVAPNKCSCPKDFIGKMGSCVPICYLEGRCKCNPGFSWNNKTFDCEENDIHSSTYYTETTEVPGFTETSMEVETDIETSNDEIDPNQVFYENIETTTYDVTDEYGSSTTSPLEGNQKCSADYVFHKGECRPLKFVSNEIDCWLKPCQDKNSVCLENGTCACNEGFKWFITPIMEHNALNQTIKSVCLTAAEYEARLQHLEQNQQKDASQEPTNWTSIFFISLGVLIIACAAIFLGLKFFLKQTGEIDVEGKNLSCAYDNRVCSEPEKSII